MAKALPDTVIARIVRNRHFRQKCLEALRNAGGDRQTLEAELDQLESDGSLSHSERAAIRVEDLLLITPDAAEKALEKINFADDINAA